MKNSTKSMILALSAFSTIALSGCGISAKEDFIIDFTYETANGNSVTEEITAQDILDRYLTNQGSTAAETYYNAIYEVALREVFTNGRFSDKLSDAQADANRDVDEAKDAADTAGTSWEDYLKDTLNIVGDMSVEDREHQYYLQCEVNAMKEIVSDEFYNTFNQWNPEVDNASEEEINEFNMVYGENGYIQTKLPYHVRDILIQVDADASNYTTGEISSEDAGQLYNLFEALVRSDSETNTYADIARRLTDDSASATNYGEHLMDLDTAFINEFKLGLYTFDALYNEDLKTNNSTFESNVAKFEMPQDVEEELLTVGPTYIPYEAVDLLNQYKDTETVKDASTGQDLTVNEGNASYYPRNIIFNKYFNSHNICFITNNKVDSSDPTNEHTYTDTGITKLTDIDENGNYLISEEPWFEDGSIEASHFQEIPGLDYPVLCDEKGNPIVVSRSETGNAGIHFVVIEKSPLENQETAEVKLNEYYAPVNPLEQNGQDANGNYYYNDEFPTDSEGNPLKTYVNSIQTTVEGYNERIYGNSDSGITGIGEKYETYTGTQKDFQLFNWVTEGNFRAKDDAIQTKVEQYINTKMLSVEQSNAQTLIDAWNSYNTTLMDQERNREIGLIPETCAIHFGDPEYYGEGKLCYYSTSLNTNPGSGNAEGTN